MNSIPMEQWKKVALDTSFLFNLHRKQNGSGSDQIDSTCESVLIALQELRKGKELEYYISSVSLGEYHNLNFPDSEVVGKILHSLNSSDVTFMPYDNEAAAIAKSYAQIMHAKGKIDHLNTEWRINHHNHVILREWITKDSMIAASAKANKCDVLLTSDYKTMYGVCEEMDQFAALCCFDTAWTRSTSGAKIYGYDQSVASAEVAIRRKTQFSRPK